MKSLEAIEVIIRAKWRCWAELLAAKQVIALAVSTITGQVAYPKTKLCFRDSILTTENMMGKLRMKLRGKIREGRKASSSNEDVMKLKEDRK